MDCNSYTAIKTTVYAGNRTDTVRLTEVQCLTLLPGIQALLQRSEEGLPVSHMDVVVLFLQPSLAADEGSTEQVWLLEKPHG